MREDVPVQEYRDFAENSGKDRSGVTNTSELKSDGSVDGGISYPMPDLAAVKAGGYATRMSPSYVGGVGHKGG